MPCALIGLRCKQRGERYSRQVARDGGLRFSSKRIRIFAAKAAEVKKRAGRCIGELMEEDRKPGRLARQKAPAQEGTRHPFSPGAGPHFRRDQSRLPAKKPAQISSQPASLISSARVRPGTGLVGAAAPPAGAAAARQAAADAELRNQLLATCRGNFTPGPGLDDMTPVRAILELVPVDYILYAIRQKVDKRCFPGNPPLTTWRDPRFLRAVADTYCSGVVIPSMVKAWGEAGKAPATKTHQSLPPVRHMPDDIDRSHHDHEHSPPGPHSLPKPPAASAAPGVTGKGPGRSVCVAFE